MAGYTTDELMIVNAARQLGALAAAGKKQCFVGIGLPSTAANLARRLYPIEPVLIYESGCIDSKPTRLPLSIGDGELAETSDAVVSVPEIFAYWLQAGRIDIGFLSGAQLDKYANMRLSARAFVDRCDFRTSIGYGDGKGDRERFGLRGGGPKWVITDLAVMEPDPDTCELIVVALHPGVTSEQVVAATGWDVRFGDDVSTTDEPTAVELDTLRALQAA
jgi:acyl CoA:acetate/3-ketoacid CoA transferase beta subunit